MTGLQISVVSRMGVIVAFGNPVYDEIVTPFVQTKGRVLSGCSTNACLALTRLGQRAMLVGSVGDDWCEQLVDDLKRYGVITHLERGVQTGGFRLIYDKHGDRTLDVMGIASTINHIPAECAGARAIIVGPILQETPLSLIEHICTVGPAPIFLDPQGLLRHITMGGRIEHFVPPDFARVAARCEVIKANELETFVLTHIEPRENPAGAARALRGLGCRIAIVTLAEAGSYIDSGEQQWHIPAYATNARDPTGAGDTYLAGFLHAYLEDPADLYRAGCCGAATASIWIEHTGPEAPITPHEVARRTHELLTQRQASED
jgi:sugar/nucleoside kinase (ribokinase family)